MERQIGPSNIRKSFTLPSLRAVIHCVFTVEVFSAVHGVNCKSYTHSTANENWGIPAWTTSSGQPSCSLGEPNIYWDGWIESKGWKEDTCALGGPDKDIRRNCILSFSTHLRKGSFWIWALVISASFSITDRISWRRRWRTFGWRIRRKLYKGVSNEFLALHSLHKRIDSIRRLHSQCPRQEASCRISAGKQDVC